MKDRELIATRLDSMSTRALGLAVQLKDIGFHAEAAAVSACSAELWTASVKLANKDFLEDPR